MDELAQLNAALREIRAIVEAVARPVEAAINERRAEAQRAWEREQQPERAVQISSPYSY